MKKIIAGLLATIAVFGAVPNGNFIVPEKSAFTASALDLDVIGKGSEGNFSCEYLSDGSIIIDGYFGTETEITIPDEINGHAVKYLNIIVYSDKEIFWAGVTKINITTNLTLISGRDYITSENAIKCFSDMGITANITGNVNQDAPPETPNEPIYELTSDTVLTIKGTGEIKHIQLDKDVKSKITKVIIENGITSIGNYAFSPNHPQGDYENGFSNLTNIIIPDSVTNIGDSAFNACKNLKQINIPNSVIQLGKYSFAGCESLSEVNIPESVTEIKMKAFASCKSLKNIIIPESVTTIDSCAFEGTGITSITLPNSISSVSNGLFRGCGYLEEVILPESITNIGTSVFENCTNLKEIMIPKNVTSIDNAFRYSELKEIIVDDSNEFYSSKDGVLFDKNMTKLIYYPTGREETSYIIPDSVTELAAFSFENSNLSDISIPDSVMLVGSYAFDQTPWYDNQPDGVIYVGKSVYNYKGEISENDNIVLKDGTKSIADFAFFQERDLVSITFPESMEYIGYQAFSNCDKLVSIELPKNVETIEKGAFWECDSLEKITIYNPNLNFYKRWSYVEDMLSDTATIYGYENSTAQVYAEKYDRKFVSLGDAPIDEPALPLGDINGDSTVDASDASNVLAVYALVSTGKESELTAEQIAAADVNKDGSIDASDASLILAYYAYISTGGTGTLEEYLNS